MMNIVSNYRFVRQLISNKNYRRWHFKHSSNLARYKDIHKGENCFIIGNGPSLNKTNLSLLSGIRTFGLNKIYLLMDRVNLELSYHVAVNPLVISQSLDIIKKLECDSFVSYMPAKGLFDSDSHVNYLFTEGGVRIFQEDITDPVSEGCTVTYVALQLAYYMGFKEVYLIGVDHSFICSGNPHEKQFLEGEDQNHFDGSYFKGMDWHLPDLISSEMAYCLARYHFTSEGRKVFDATIDGRLDVFPKIHFEEAVSRCSKNR